LEDENHQEIMSINLVFSIWARN